MFKWKCVIRITNASLEGTDYKSVPVRGDWQNHHTADVLIGLASTYGLALLGPAGWAIGAGYFLLDYGINAYSGKSITEILFDPR